MTPEGWLSHWETTRAYQLNDIVSAWKRKDETTGVNWLEELSLPQAENERLFEQ